MIDPRFASIASAPLSPVSPRLSLPYLVQGNRAGIPVILLHGYSDSLHSYDQLLPHLPASVRAFALTQRGHGTAPRPTVGYAPADFAADLAAFLNQQEIEQAVIVGHSLGTAVAQRFALDYPERALGIVLMGAIRSWRDNPALVELAELAPTLEDPIDPAFVREFQESTIARAVPDEFLRVIIQESLQVPARVWRAAVAEFVANDFASELNNIAAPTLILWGEEDAYMPRVDQDALAATIPDARLITYPGIGHAPHWEDPERVAADLQAFVEYAARHGSLAMSQ